MAYPRMIDVSQYQPTINWLRLHELGVGVIARAGQSNFEDSLFRQHYANAQTAGVLLGMYWFYQPNLAPQLQIDACLKLYNSLTDKPHVIALDVENIAYYSGGEYINILPPSPSTHTEWLRTWLTAIEHAIGIVPMIYTRQDYWNAWVHRSPEWSHYPLWVASWTAYSADVRLPADWAEWKVWQYEGGTGRQDGVTGPVDLDYFNGNQAEMEQFFGQTGGSMMAALYNTQIAQKDRARVLTLEPNQKVNAPIANLGINAVILPMGGMHNWDGSHWKVISEPTFPGRFDLFAVANIPVLGRFDLDAGSLIAEQHGMAEFVGRAIRDNWILPFLLKSWLIGEFSWDVVLGKQGRWRNLSAIIISEVNIEGWPASTTTNDAWQKTIFDYVVYHLKYLMDNGMAPRIPIICYTGPWWLSLYPGEMAVEWQNDKSWLYLHLGQWTLTSTATFATLAEIFAFPPADTFKFSSYPDGYFDRILLHEFTGERQKCAQVTDAAGNPVTVNLSLWNDTKEVMLAFLKYGQGPEPGHPCAEQEAYIDELLNQIGDLQAQMVQMNDTIASQGEKLARWETWLAGAPR